MWKLPQGIGLPGSRCWGIARQGVHIIAVPLRVRLARLVAWRRLGTPFGLGCLGVGRNLPAQRPGFGLPGTGPLEPVTA